MNGTREVGGGRLVDMRSMEGHARTIQRLFDEIWNGRNYDAIDELYHPTYVADYRPYAPLREGSHMIRDMVERAYTTFPDYHEDLLSVLVEGDRAAVHLRITGTQLGAWGPVPPTGRRLEYEEMLILTFAPDGRVLHQRGIVDNLAALRQLGVAPTPPQP